MSKRSKKENELLEFLSEAKEKSMKNLKQS